MITILSFIARKDSKLIFAEVFYDLETKKTIYSSFNSLEKKIEKKVFNNIVIPTAYYQADLKFAIENGYKVIINPKI